MPDREPAAEVEHARRPVEFCAASQRDVDQPLHREQALGALRELRADVDVQACDVEPCRSRVADGSDRVVGDEPELRLGVRGLDRTMRLGLDARE